jgi:AcrR family transcriptional regulator
MRDKGNTQSHQNAGRAKQDIGMNGVHPMKRDTRQEILDTAKVLFNERGYNNVTLRDIAGAMSISKGNLTYHFKKKEEIIEALLTESPNTKPVEAPLSIEALDAYFLNMQRAVQENAYYFLHYTQLSQIIPKIREGQRLSYLTLTSFLNETFCTLHSDGLLRSEAFPGEYACIIDALHLSGIFWNSFNKLKQQADSQKTYQHHAWGLMYGLLTKKGKAKLTVNLINL